MEKQINGHPFVEYQKQILSDEEMEAKSKDFYQFMDTRRSVRDFSDRPIPKSVIENILKTAGTAPSGAHKQPWKFCVISSLVIKKKIREAAEKEEYESYTKRMSDRWLKDLEPIGTNWEKPFLEKVPYIIVVFKKIYDEQEDKKATNYYVNESVGLAAGFLISAIHNAGLATLTHTPSPMNFLSEILERPKNERPFLLLPVGYPAEECYVPKLERKPIQQTSVFYE